MSIISLLGGQGDPTEFQRACSRRLAEVLSGHGLGPATFVLGEGAPEWYWMSFQIAGKDHRIEIYPKIVVMHQDDRYFESYMPYEFKSEASLVDGFANRLDRYLSGGPWADPSEQSFAEVVKGKLARLFRGRQSS